MNPSIDSIRGDIVIPNMKKTIMKQYWRLQQSQSIASLLLWTSTITLLVWPYVSWRFEEMDPIMGISPTYIGLIAIATLVISSIFFIGYAYDQILSLWKDHRTVDTERNPFATYALIPANVVLIGQMNELLRRHASDDEQVQETCSWVDEWLQWCGEQEIWVRSQKFWDENLETPVPPFHFFPDGLVENARGRASDINEDSN